MVTVVIQTREIIRTINSATDLCFWVRVRYGLCLIFREVFMKNKILSFLMCLSLVFVYAVCHSPGSTDSGLMSEKNTDTPSVTQTYHFDSYEELAAFIQSNTVSAQDKAEWGEDYVDYILEAASASGNRTPLYFPCYEGEPVPLRQKEGFSGITFMTAELYNLPWIWYYTRIGEEELTIKVACLSRKDFARVEVQSASVAVRNFGRRAPNIDNYEACGYQSVSEKTIQFSGAERSALYLVPGNAQKASLQFAYGKTMVIITGSPSVLNSEIIGSLSLKELDLS